MKFDDGHKVIFETLDKEEARAFKYFLEAEADRHAYGVSDIVGDELIRSPTTKYDKALNRFWRSEVKRHNKDTIEIDELLKRIKDKFG